MHFQNQELDLPKGGSEVRVGLRPFAVGGLPIIGPVPGLEKVYIAAGHEGSGLCLGPATATIIRNHMLGEQGPPSPFFNPSA
jgi:glycine/D-amino acid oxidase-like deaminating enzyme